MAVQMSREVEKPKENGKAKKKKKEKGKEIPSDED